MPQRPQPAAPAPAAEAEASSLLWQLDATGRYADAHRATSAALGCLALAASAAAVFVLTQLGAAISSEARFAGFRGAESTLEVFDTRFGYSAADVTETLRAWGPRGASLYFVAQAVDTAVYVRAYRAAAVVACNALARCAARRAPGLRPRFMTALALAPLVIAALDRCENAAQVALTGWHELSLGAAPDMHPGLWRALAAVSSGLNVAKWSAVRAFAAALAAAALATAARVGSAAKQR
jgi:hypothetical protein